MFGFPFDDPVMDTTFWLCALSNEHPDQIDGCDIVGEDDEYYYVIEED